MSEQVKVYGIPTCGSCKKAIAWLKENSIEYQFVNTRENPPTREMIQAWVEILGTKPLKNTSGASYRGLGDQKNDWDDSQWVQAFADDPMLLKRPVIEVDKKVIGVGFRNADQVTAALKQ